MQLSATVNSYSLHATIPKYNQFKISIMLICINKKYLQAQLLAHPPTIQYHTTTL